MVPRSLPTIMQLEKERKKEITKYVLVGWMVDLPARQPPLSPPLLSSLLVLIIGSARDRKSGLKFDLAELVAGRRGAGGRVDGRGRQSGATTLIHTSSSMLGVYSHFNGQICFVFLPIQILTIVLVPVNRG